MNKLTDTFSLNNGVKIPCVGFGTWRAAEGEEAYSSVLKALEVGYRHIDTAAAYGNEKSVGRAVRDSGINREEIFVTSKLWNTERGYDKAMAAFDKTMNELGLEYLDLYLLHWPAAPKQFSSWKELNRETWGALEELYKAGKIKAIGVSNFWDNFLSALLEDITVVPAVNQIEFHPGLLQAETVSLCKEKNILVEAWSPMAKARILDNEVLNSIAAKYSKSTAQLCIRWVLQHGVLPLPKSVTPSRIAENTQIFDFEISSEDMKTIDELPYCGGSNLDPNTVDF